MQNLLSSDKTGVLTSVAYFAFNVVTSVAIVIFNKFLMSPKMGIGFKYCK